VYSGSTACMIIHYYDINEKKNILWSINVGDTRAVLANRDGLAIQLSKDHKPNAPSEKKRIEGLGGKIEHDGYVWRVGPLSLSRSFGDTDSAPYVTHVPEIFSYKVSSNDLFIILACDGLWEVLNNQDAIDFIQNLRATDYVGNYAKALCDHALQLGTTDNVSVIVYML
jgi:serine/threonine protein phosphatase PrpC